VTFNPFIKKMILCLAVISVFINPVLAETVPPPEVRADFGLSVSDFNWSEYSDAGNRVLEETGQIYGLDADIVYLHQRFGWQGGAGAFLGEVDYDGRTWSGTPIQTDVLYAGGSFHGDGLVCFRPISGLILKSFAGLGAQAWLRDLDDTRTAAGVPVQGAEEWWGCVYGRLGTGFQYGFLNDYELFASGGVKLPIYARNEVDFQLRGSGWTGLEPEMTVSGFGEAGLCWRQAGVKLSCDFLRFDRSRSVDAGTYNLYQPESKADVYRAELFWRFGKGVK